MALSHQLSHPAGRPTIARRALPCLRTPIDSGSVTAPAEEPG
jgi:hypothetical protein